MIKDVNSTNKFQTGGDHTFVRTVVVLNLKLQRINQVGNQTKSDINIIIKETSRVHNERKSLLNVTKKQSQEIDRRDQSSAQRKEK